MTRRLAPWGLLLLLPLAALAADPEGPPPPDVPPPAPTAPPAYRRVPAGSLEEAKLDPRFARHTPDSDARVRVRELLEGYPYFGIPQNGCGAGKNFVAVDLLAPFDDMPAGTSVVLRIEDLTLGPTVKGGTFAYSGLRRAGKGPDGTPVYCGRGSAFKIHS